MMPKAPLLSLLILGSLSVLGLREQPSNELVRETAVYVISRCKHADELEDCRETCTLDRRYVPLPNETEGRHKAAWSLLDGGPDTSRPSTITEESDTIISPVVMACVSLVLATGVCSYLVHIST